MCELNYTPEVDGEIDIEKALHTTEAFELSRQFWAYFVESEGIDPSRFIHSIPHMSFVTGKDISFLEKRYEKMKSHHFYKKMQFSKDRNEINKWAPLAIKNRANPFDLPEDQIAATYVESGTDVNFGELTKLLVDSLIKSGVTIKYNCKVKNLVNQKHGNKYWEIQYSSEEEVKILSKRIFIGAGGASLLLLEKTKIPESKGYGGFPISGQWLICKNKDVINQHNVKLYGKASVGAPPMSVPHLDTRIIDNEKQLLFGPFAGFSSKFLKNGSYWDLFKSIKIGNIWSMIKAGWNNIPLTYYLVTEVIASFSEKMDELRKYYPDAKNEDWELQTAGQRVQVIKKDKEKGGVLEFGTEMVISKDGNTACILGASPGASTVVYIMSKVVEKMFPELVSKLISIIPSYGTSLLDDEETYNKIIIGINKELKTK